MSGPKLQWSEKMSRVKRKSASSDRPSVKQAVTIKSVDKWIAESDKQLSTTVWLCYNNADREHVSTLKCSICIQFQEKLCSHKNFSSAFILGSKNLCMSFKDHATSGMHQHAMTLYKDDAIQEEPVWRTCHCICTDY